MPECPRCGKELVAKCTEPGCTAHVEVYSRPVGYLRPVSCWNDGKQQEFAERRTFVLKDGGHAEQPESAGAQNG